MSGQLQEGGRLYLPVARAGTLHMGVSRGAAPVRGKILLPKFKEISRIAKEHAERTKHWCGGKDTQNDMDVGNVGKDFMKVVEGAFGEGKVRRILFPAAYVGRVAKEISDAGFEVVCTDVQRMWVENARRLGMEAHVLSAEEFPPGKFDIVACFEPYPLHNNPLGLIFALRTMAETDGMVMANEVPNRKFAELAPLDYPTSWYGPERIILAYGSSGSCWENDIRYEAIRTTQMRRERAGIDLETVGALEGMGRASVAGLAEHLGRKIREMEDSLVRIVGAIYKVCDYDGLESMIRAGISAGIGDGEAGNHLALATGITSLNDYGKPVGGLSYRDFIQELEITD